MGTEASAEVVQRSSAAAPAWTESNEHDPGITMLGLFAFLTTGLLYRAGGRADGERTRSWTGALGVGLVAGATAALYAKSRSRRRAAADAVPPRTDESS